MNKLRWVLAGIAVSLGVVFAATRRGSYTAMTANGDLQIQEPILGYDGMDQETLLEWLDEAELDDATLHDIRDYESTYQRREPVLAAIEDLLG